MKDAKDPKDRRVHPRADARLAAGVRAAIGTDLVAVTTLNVGAGGVYVEVPHFIEPLTKLEIVLELPAAKGTLRVETEAIVVRTQPDHADPAVSRYQVACAFLTLAPSHREAIQHYVASLKAPAGL